ERRATGSGDPRTWLGMIVELAPELRPEGTPAMKVGADDPCSRGADPAWDTRLAPGSRPEGTPAMKVWADDPCSRGAYTAWDHRSLSRQPQFERMHGAIAFA